MRGRAEYVLNKIVFILTSPLDSDSTAFLRTEFVNRSAFYKTLVSDGNKAGFTRDEIFHAKIFMLGNGGSTSGPILVLDCLQLGLDYAEEFAFVFNDLTQSRYKLLEFIVFSLNLFTF